MARPKNTKTKKKTASVKAPASPATVKVVATEETKAETAPAAAEPAPVVEAPAAKTIETNFVLENKVKTASKKKSAPAKTEAPKKDVFLIQSNGKDYTMDDIKEACKEAYKNGTRKHVKSIDVYLKAENGGLRAYYVINGKADGAFIDL